MANTINIISEIIQSYRLGVDREGNRALADFTEWLLPVLNEQSATLTEDDLNFVTELLTAQERTDYLYIADLLQYDLPVGESAHCCLYLVADNLEWGGDFS